MIDPRRLREADLSDDLSPPMERGKSVFPGFKRKARPLVLRFHHSDVIALRFPQQFNASVLRRRVVRPRSQAQNRLQLPETVIIAALMIDSERAVPWDLQWRMGDLAASLNCCVNGCIYVGNKPVGPHHRIFRIP